MKKKAWIVLLLAMLMLLLLVSCAGGPAGTNGEETQEGDNVAAVDEVGNGRHVMIFVMGDELNTTTSNKWRKWDDNSHEPDKTVEGGLRDISSVYYPSIGLYDVMDPDYQEYMMQLCKMCYIDTINYFVHDAEHIAADGNDWSRNFDTVTVEMLRKYGLSSTARLATIPEDTYVEAPATLTALLEKLGDTVLTIDGRPVLAQFGTGNLEPGQLAKWKTSYAAAHDGVEPFLMTWQHGKYMYDGWMNVSEGQYGWVELDDSAFQTFWNNGNYIKYADLETAKANHDSTVAIAQKYVKYGILDFYAEALSPGFDSTGCWGWGDGPSKVERGENGELYEYKWQSAVENGFPMVVIPTWDDWGEGSTIEPSLEYGVEYLEITRKYAAEYKGIEVNTASLELPGWIYKIRKVNQNPEVLAVMDEASRLIAESRYDEAEALVRPYAEQMGIPMTSKEFFKYPTSYATPLIPPVKEVDNTPTVEGDTETWMAVADTYLIKNRETDYGTGSEMIVKKLASSPDLTRRAYIKFDTTETTLEGVAKATLRIYCTHLPSTTDEDIDINLYAVNADWEELTFNWDTQPTAIQKVADVDLASFKADNWIEIDVTEYVQAHLGEPIAFAFWSEGGDHEGTLQFKTRETLKKEPQLVLVAGEKVVPIEPVTLVSIADTYVQETRASEFGALEQFVIKSDEEGGLAKKAFVKFDTSSVEYNTINSAVLRLYCRFASTQQKEVKIRDYKLYAVASEWEEMGMKWSTQPALGDKLADINTKKAKKDMWIEIDVTDYVKANLGGTIAFAICNEGASSAENQLAFGSREAVGQEPQLVIR